MDDKVIDNFSLKINSKSPNKELNNDTKSNWQGRENGPSIFTKFDQKATNFLI